MKLQRASFWDRMKGVQRGCRDLTGNLLFPGRNAMVLKVSIDEGGKGRWVKGNRKKWRRDERRVARDARAKMGGRRWMRAMDQSRWRDIIHSVSILRTEYSVQGFVQLDPP